MARVQLEAIGLEFEEGGNTIWIHGSNTIQLRRSWLLQGSLIMKITAKTKLKIGDVVSLGDGPAMTVETIGRAHVRCMWFGINDRAQWTGPYLRRFRRDRITHVWRGSAR